MALLTQGQLIQLETAGGELKLMSGRLQTLMNNIAGNNRRRQHHPAFQALAQMKDQIDEAEASVVRVAAKNGDNFRGGIGAEVAADRRG